MQTAVHLLQVPGQHAQCSRAHLPVPSQAPPPAAAAGAAAGAADTAAGPSSEYMSLALNK